VTADDHVLRLFRRDGKRQDGDFDVNVVHLFGRHGLETRILEGRGRGHFHDRIGQRLEGEGVADAAPKLPPAG